MNARWKNLAAMLVIAVLTVCVGMAVVDIVFGM